MDGKGYCLVYIVCVIVTEASGMPLRRAEFLLDSENDSVISGKGFWKGDDEGYTFSEHIAVSFLWEDREDPHSDVFKCTLTAGSFLFNRFEGTDTPEGARKQFPREQNFAFLEAVWGRTPYVRLLLGIQDTNFEPQGRGFLTTYQQYAFHRLSRNSQDVENLVLKRSNTLSGLGGFGVGGELPLWPSSLEECLLIRGDVGARLDFLNCENSLLESQCVLLLGFSKITEGMLSPFVFMAGVNGSLGREGVQLFAEVGFEWNIPLSHETYVTLRSRARAPIISTGDDFYDPNPEMVLGIVVGCVWDRK